MSEIEETGKNLEFSDYTSTNMPKTEVINLLEHSLYVEEIFFQLTHEINKIYFLLSTVRKIFTFQHQNSLIDIFLIFGVNILMLAKHRTNYLIHHLIQGKKLLDIFRLHEFLQSKFQTQLLNRLYQTRNYCAKMEKDIRKDFRFMHYIKKLKLHRLFRQNQLEDNLIPELQKTFITYYLLNFSNPHFVKFQK